MKILVQAVAIRQLLVLCLVVYEKIYLKYDSYTTLFIIVRYKSNVLQLDIK